MGKQKRSMMSLVWVLARTDFRLRYQGSVLGFLWALLKPLALFGVLLVVFSHFFSADIPFYSFQLLTALLMWMFFAEGTMLGLTSLQAKAHVLKKIAFPRIVIVLAALLQALMTFFIHLFLLSLVLFFSGLSLTVMQVVNFVLLMFLVVILVLTISLIAAPLYIRFRDLHQIWEVFLLVGFYAAPVLYPMKSLPETVQAYLYLNPMTLLLMETKSVLFTGFWVNGPGLLQYALILVCFFLFALFLFQRLESRVIELL